MLCAVQSWQTTILRNCLFNFCFDVAVLRSLVTFYYYSCELQQAFWKQSNRNMEITSWRPFQHLSYTNRRMTISFQDSHGSQAMSTKRFKQKAARFQSGLPWASLFQLVAGAHCFYRTALADCKCTCPLSWQKCRFSRSRKLLKMMKVVLFLLLLLLVLILLLLLLLLLRSYKLNS